MPEAAIGNVPDVGSTHLLAQAPGNWAPTRRGHGARLTGADAIACRLADLLVPAPRLPHLVAALATRGDPATVAQFAPDPGPSPLLARPG